MNILVVDGQGGGLGKKIVESIKKNITDTFITAIGTNSIATAVMLKAGADKGVTGENPVIVACKKADVIIGPIGIVIADSMDGEITPAMAVAVGQSDAVRILVPINHCNNIVAGVKDLSINESVLGVIEQLKALKKSL